MDETLAVAMEKRTRYLLSLWEDEAAPVLVRGTR